MATYLIRYRTPRHLHLQLVETVLNAGIAVSGDPVAGTDDYDIIFPPTQASEILSSFVGREKIRKFIVLNAGGTAEKEVNIAEIGQLDFAHLALYLPTPSLQKVLDQYQEDLVALVEAIVNDTILPNKFLVPDLWQSSCNLPKQEKDKMREVWALGHNLANAIWQITDHNNPIGTTFLRK
jgi:hypothetical protein